MKKVLIKSAIALAMTAGVSTTAAAGCGAGSLYCNSGSSVPSLSTYNSTSYSSYSSGATQYVPFSSASAPSNGSFSIAGLGSNEFLQPTSCPVNVNGMQAGQSVLGCYSVMKQTPRITYAQPHTTRIVRPIIYVRYPVPTPVYTVPVPVPTPYYRPMPMCGAPMMMPRPMSRGCGW